MCFAVVLASCVSLQAASESRSTGAAVARPARSSAALEQDVVELVNRHRRARGLAPLALDARVAQQARLHSEAMAAGKTPFGHDGFPARVAAVRRAMAVRSSPYALTGVGVASNAKGEVYLAQIFVGR